MRNSAQNSSVFEFGYDRSRFKDIKDDDIYYKKYLLIDINLYINKFLSSIYNTLYYYFIIFLNFAERRILK